jgi:hypothetical protein
MKRQFSHAAGEYEKALHAEPSNPEAAWGVVYACNLSGRPEAGERRGGELLHSRPRDERLGLHDALSLALLHRPSPAIVYEERFALFFGGTFAPFFLASESPMAIACLRLFTLPPRPSLPLFSVPRL